MLRSVSRVEPCKYAISPFRERTFTLKLLVDCWVALVDNAIASGCEDGSIALVHPVTGQVLASLQLEQQARTPAASASDSSSSSASSVLGVCFRRSQGHLLSACRDNAVRLWDVRKRAVVRTFAVRQLDSLQSSLQPMDGWMGMLIESFQLRYQCDGDHAVLRATQQRSRVSR